ncbi:MAG: aminotransferase class V-fold PLP-dependent enzyme [Desulfomonilia bacterium]
MMNEQPIYFDNAATSWPKPRETIDAITRFGECVGANPGRSGHSMSVQAAREVLDTRDSLSQLFHVDDMLRIVFTRNATEALNLVFSGLLKDGDHVITSSMEHNSVMRPLRRRESQGVELTVVRCSDTGMIDPDDVRAAIRPGTRMIVITHASNVTGTIMPISDIGAMAREHGCIFCVDAAQTAGSVNIDVQEMKIDLLAFTGHKALFGPQGTGGLYIGPDLENEVQPLVIGGTGSMSEFEHQPDFLPDKYESGTPNAMGIAGLGAGVRFLLKLGLYEVTSREADLREQLVQGLEDIPGVTVYGSKESGSSIANVSFTIESIRPSDVTLALDEHYAVMSRPGLHCAPSAHRTIGTFPQGTVRLSLGYFNTSDQVRYVLQAVSEVAAGTMGKRAGKKP